MDNQLQNIAGRFESVAERYADKIAVVCHEKRITYKELNEKANGLAHRLMGLGLEPGTFVGVCAARSIDMIAGIIAVLKAGCVYIPLDSGTPQGRLHYILQDAGALALLIQKEEAPRFAEFPGAKIYLDDPLSEEIRENPKISRDSHDPAYLIYTSGSTGHPKGVLVEQGSLLHLYDHIGPFLGFTHRDQWALFHSFSFDVSVWEMWGALLFGGCVIIVPYTVSRSPLAFYRLLCDEKVTVLNQTPMAFYHLLETDKQESGALSLRYIMIGGEALDFSRLSEWYENHTEDNPRLIDIYGLTETTVNAALYPLTRKDVERRIPVIGKPIPGVSVFLLDERMQEVKMGEAGEICVAGRSLARGYFNDPALTAERFGQYKGKRIYHTGDLARLNEEGNLEFLGRRDNQVKIHGFRIELGEIESLLRRHPLISASTVLLREDRAGEKLLAAYIVNRPEALGETSRADHIRDWNSLCDGVYAEADENEDPTFNIKGWNSSYTGKPLPESEMSFWLDSTIERIRDLQPKRALEIGCGLGLLLFRLAPHCQAYGASDFSRPAIESLRRLTKRLPDPESVALWHRDASDFGGFESFRPDTIILNSVVHYFPDIDYLFDILKKAVKLLKGKGQIFIGDVRNFLLLESFHQSVLTFQSRSPMDPVILERRVRQRIAEEKELLIDPAFFASLNEAIPEISSIRIWPKRGSNHNELTCFRYDVVLSVGGSLPSTNAKTVDWSAGDFTQDKLPGLLRGAPVLVLRNVPNARTDPSGVDPEVFWSWKGDCKTEVSWLHTDKKGAYDVIFSQASQGDFQIPHLPAGKEGTPRERCLLANAPYKVEAERKFMRSLKTYLQASLPDYMVPNAMTLVAEIPLNLSGKVDHQALPIPEKSRFLLENSYAAPSTEQEQELARLWCDILGVEQVGMRDNFFELGGDSLKALKAIARMRSYHVHVSFDHFFAEPTLEALLKKSHNKEDSTEVPAATSYPASYPLSPLQEGILYHILRSGDKELYQVCFLLELEGPIEAKALKEACRAVVNRHPALRSSFHWQDVPEPCQRVAESVEFPFDEEDWRGLTKQDQERALALLVESNRVRGFELTRPPLFRFALLQLSESRFQFVFNYMHLILSEWEQFTLFREIFLLHEGYRLSRDVPLPPVRPYSCYIDYLQNLDRNESKTFWRDYLSDCTFLELPIVRSQPDKAEGYQESTLTLNRDFSEALTAYAGHHGITLNTLFTGAYAILLSRYCRQDDVLFGMVFSGRNLDCEGLENTLGLFINTLPLRIGCPGDDPVGPWLKAIQQNVFQLSRYEHSSLAEIKTWSGAGARQELFESILVFDDEPLDAFLNKQGFPFDVRGMKILYESTNYPLTLAVMKGETVNLRVLFNQKLFAENTVRALLTHYRTVLTHILSHSSGVPLRDISLLTEEETRRTLMSCNQTATDYPRDASISQLFEEQAARRPSEIALVEGDREITYEECNARANRLAAGFLKDGLKAGSRIALCMGCSADRIIALLAVLKCGCAYVALDPDYPAEGLKQLLEDLDAPLLLTQESLVSRFSFFSKGKTICLDRPDGDLSGEEGSDIPFPGDALTPAYISFTSGSTGKPKGVLANHRNVIRLFRNSGDFSLTSQDVFFQFAPLSFDASTFEIWACLLNGGKLVIMPIAKPSLAQLGRVIADSGVTTLWLTSGLFHQMIDEQLEDLRGVRQLLTGGDVVSVDHVRRGLEGLKETTIISCYGPTENTVFTSCYSMNHPDRILSTVPIGYPVSNTQVYILDQQGSPVPEGLPGELYTGGDGVSVGYYNSPGLTAERFVSPAWFPEKGDRLYKTGDLVRRTENGALEFIGRVDQQVKIRGFRVEPGEVKFNLVQHPRVKDAIVLTQARKSGEKKLVAYVVTEEGEEIPRRELRGFLGSRVPSYMIPEDFHFLSKLPLTPTGKVDRQALPTAEEPVEDAAYEAPKRESEELLVGIWEELLERDKIGIHDDFFLLGGHSLMATRMISRIRNIFHVELPITELFDFPTPEKLVDRIEAIRKGVIRTLHPVPGSQDGNLPLSFAQQRLWFIHSFEPNSAAYNIVSGLVLSGELDLESLGKSINTVIERHESLRTSFPAPGGKACQKIHPSLTVELLDRDCSALVGFDLEQAVDRAAMENYLAPFDLARLPLIRFRLLKTGPRRHILFTSMHHIISDGWSMGIFYKEMETLYNGYTSSATPLLPALPIQYADFAVTQRQWLQGEIYDHQLSYWKKRLAGLKMLKLPCDYPHPVVQRFNGEGLTLKIPLSTTEELETFSRKQKLTLFMTLLSAFYLLLHRYTGEEDIAIGSPIANRNHLEIEGLIGFFVNTLVLRVALDPIKPFVELLDQVRRITIDAYANQDLPFEALVEQLRPERSTAVNPLVQVVFALQSSPMDLPCLNGIEVTPFPYRARTVRFDLEVHFWRNPSGLEGLLIYNTDLFERGTMEQFSRHYEYLLKEILEDPQRTPDEIPLMSESDRLELLQLGDRTDAAFPLMKTITDFFEEQVDRDPEGVALIIDKQAMTYGELNARANQLARYLMSRGVTTGVPVGVYMPRSFAMILSLIAILKAGGFYVPLYLDDPEERLNYVIDDLSIPLVLIKGGTGLAGNRAQEVDLERIESKLLLLGKDNPSVELSGKSTCYVMYTSGSTGRPKGVSIPHHGVTRLVKGCDYVTLNPEETILQYAPLAFDASTFEIWGALLNGGRLLIATPEKLTPAELGGIIKEGGVSTLWLTAPLFKLMADTHPDDLAGVRQLLAGGEVLSPEAVRKILERIPSCTVINGYGPTENTTFTCCYPMTHPDQIQTSVPIGYPIRNTKVYILDRNLQPIPRGVGGELYAGGAGLALGYWNQPELTKERFIQDPFDADGGRLYRTGDLARLRHDNAIEFIGRRDNQVKIRGFRVEPAEIDQVLLENPLVEASLTLTDKDHRGNTRLISYLIPHFQRAKQILHTKEDTKQVVRDWEVVFDQKIYEQSEPIDLDFNFIGWNDSATGKAIPFEEMTTWANYRIEKILSLHPQRVLEIGCGMGILLEKIAPHTRLYVGTDISRKSLEYVSRMVTGLPQVRLLNIPAHDLEPLGGDIFDCCILNSIIQYFPDLDYLVTLLTGIIDKMSPGGSIFLGDIRNLKLIKSFYAGVILAKGTPSSTRSQLRSGLDKRLSQERELLIDPDLFSLLPSLFPQISRVEVNLQRGRQHNELTRYRYDVLISVKDEPRSTALVNTVLDWNHRAFTLSDIREKLISGEKESLLFKNIPNERIRADLQNLAWIESENGAERLKDLHPEGDLPPFALDPEDIWELSARTGYQVNLSWTPGTSEGLFDALFWKGEHPATVLPESPDKNADDRDWQRFANNPIQKELKQKIRRRLREDLQKHLPSYMVPSDFVLLNHFPLNQNGKVDRSALLQFQEENFLQDRPIVYPQNNTQLVIAAVWKDILQIDSVSIEENFFDLGGDSLLLVQVCERLKKELSHGLSVVDMFQYPTIKKLSDYLGQEEKITAVPGDRTEKRKKSLSRQRGPRGRR